MPYVLVLMTFLALQGAAPATTGNWPQWRGPSQDGVSRETGLPSSWGAKCLDGTGVQPAAAQASDPAAVQPQGRGRGGGREGRPIVHVSCSKMDTQNVAWKLPLPAYSGSTPIIWGNTIFLNMATAANTGALELWAIDRTNQTVLWKRPIADGNHMERKQNMSSPSPLTDGRTVWVMTGVGVLKAFDFGGKELWSRNIQADYGKFGLNWGYASTPLLRGDALYVQVLHGMKTDDPSYVMKIDGKTGKTIWRVERLTEAVSESPDSYTTPAWIEAGGRSELVIYRRRCRFRARPGDGQGTLARRRPESETRPQLPHHRLADDRRWTDHRADPEQPAGRAAARRERRRRLEPRGVDVCAGARRADAGERRQAALRRPRQRRRVRARREDRPHGVWTGAPAVW